MNDNSWHNAWIDLAELKEMREFATLMSESRGINYQFYNDIPTCLQLVLMAKGWNLSPYVVGANSFYNHYGNIDHNGKLYKLILEHHPDVEDLKVEFSGDWSKIENKYRQEGDCPLANWGASEEVDLFCEVTVLLRSGEQYAASTYLKDVDMSVRQMNPAWVVRPANQITNFLIRRLATGSLAHVVLGMNSQDAFHEAKAREKSAPPKSKTSQTPVKNNAGGEMSAEQDPESNEQEVNATILQIKSGLADIETDAQLNKRSVGENKKALAKAVDEIQSLSPRLNQKQKDTITRSYQKALEACQVQEGAKAA